MGLEIPGSRFDSGAGEPVAAYGVAECGVDRLRTLELTTDDTWQQHALDHIAGAGEGFLGVERELKRRRLAVPDVAGIVVEHDDHGSAFGHGAARDDERLEQRERELEQLSAGDAHREEDRGSAGRRRGARGIRPLHARA